MFTCNTLLIHNEMHICNTHGLSFLMRTSGTSYFPLFGGIYCALNTTELWIHTVIIKLLPLETISTLCWLLWEDEVMVSGISHPSLASYPRVFTRTQHGATNSTTFQTICKAKRFFVTIHANHPGSGVLLTDFMNFH